jgi:hypothetical protein
MIRRTMGLRFLALAFAAVVLGTVVASDAEARKGGRSGGQGSGKSWHGKGHGWHGGHKHRHGHVFIGAGFYGPWFYDPWYSWYRYPLYPYPVSAPIPFEQQYIEQYAVPLQQGFWYYCHSGGAYYPGVAECPEGWEQVAPQ